MSARSSVDYKNAKKLFFDYDGSRFYMSRDDVVDSYIQAQVPPQIEAQWLAELKVEKLAALEEPGNWKTVYFLQHHGMYDCEQMVLQADPKGTLVERIIYLEVLLDYLRQYPPLPSHALKVISSSVRQKLVERAWTELRVARSKEMKKRINDLLRRAGKDVDRTGR